MREKVYYFKLYMPDVKKTNGDLALLAWYSALKDYAKRFRRDKNGFTRVSSAVFEKDFGINRVKVWRMNKKLAELGLIILDTASGGRNWVGFKVL